MMKIAPIAAELKRRGDEFEHVLVHTGQHYDRELSATNALDVQSEVAAAVSDALKDVLTSSHVDRRVVVSTTAVSSFSEGRVAESVRLP